jgi:hypothetical protein
VILQALGNPNLTVIAAEYVLDDKTSHAAFPAYNGQGKLDMSLLYNASDRLRLSHEANPACSYEPAYSQDKCRWPNEASPVTPIWHFRRSAGLGVGPAVLVVLLKGCRGRVRICHEQVGDGGQGIHLLTGADGIVLTVADPIEAALQAGVDVCAIADGGLSGRLQDRQNPV